MKQDSQEKQRLIIEALWELWKTQKKQRLFCKRKKKQRRAIEVSGQMIPRVIYTKEVKYRRKVQIIKCHLLEQTQ